MYEARNGKPGGWFRYTLRLRSPRIDRDKGKKETARSIFIEWRKMDWATYPDGKKKYRAKYIRKAAGSYRYATSRFRPVNDKERNLIENLEDQFAEIRTQVSIIGSIRKTLANQRRRIERKAGGQE